jgi:hypothetical protein
MATIRQIGGQRPRSAGGAANRRGARDLQSGGELGVMQSDLARANLTIAGIHPNEVDRKRIERALQNRQRYRYVTPEVQAIAEGYLIRSACCSRNIDPEGGIIDIAKLAYRRERDCWWLYHKDHAIGHWIRHGEYPALAPILELLQQDPARRFWQ